jgi:hypothetical protein
MSKVFVYFILLLSYTAFSQSIESLEKRDTLYIRFDAGKSQELFFKTDNSGKIISEWFYFYFGDPAIHLLCTHSYGVEPASKTIKKSFLKKHKEAIIGPSFFKEHTLEAIATVLRGHTTVCIIDESSNTLTVKEVRVQTSLPSEE